MYIKDLNTGKYNLNPVVWVASEKDIVVNETANTVTYLYVINRPIENGIWKGFFLEFEFPYLDKNYLVVTTETNIVPEWYPFPDCYGVGCYGKLV